MRAPIKSPITLWNRAALVLAGAVLAAPVHAAVPPPCKPVPITLDTALKGLKKWRGWRPLARAQLLEPQLDPCLSTNDTARLTTRVAVRHGKDRTLWIGEAIISLSAAKARPIDSKAQRGQVKALAKQLTRVPAKVVRDPVVVAFTKAYGAFERAIVDDEGGYGPACYQLTNEGASGRAPAELTWCDGKAGGVTRMNLPAGRAPKIRLVVRVNGALSKARPGCSMARTSLTRYLSDGKRMWRISARLSGDAKKGCRGSWRGKIAD